MAALNFTPYNRGLFARKYTECYIESTTTEIERGYINAAFRREQNTTNEGCLGQIVGYIGYTRKNDGKFIIRVGTNKFNVFYERTICKWTDFDQLGYTCRDLIGKHLKATPASWICGYGTPVPVDGYKYLE